MRSVLIVMSMLILAGCAGITAQSVPPAPILCQVPAGLLNIEDSPAIPQNEYSQQDVAMYISKLHQWAWRGWLRVDAVDKWVIENCGRK
ncbi:hypothetical protein [Zhongshania aliphaticivorans]|jgi:hypothetical protein|uniref:hypothetical protein n=1 Tax=Zhongshania aliphaticivorans TaxID=1470434 RepID=UPI0012E5373F|nr:hypothetical protein [Zhongshania aliphaticivorans]CAA0103382.1 Uncharacterised protein [Zhongshania aliphaticivorans]